MSDTANKALDLADKIVDKVANGASAGAQGIGDIFAKVTQTLSEQVAAHGQDALDLILATLRFVSIYHISMFIFLSAVIYLVWRWIVVVRLVPWYKEPEEGYNDEHKGWCIVGIGVSSLVAGVLMLVNISHHFSLYHLATVYDPKLGIAIKVLDKVLKL